MFAKIGGKIADPNPCMAVRRAYCAERQIGRTFVFHPNFGGPPLQRRRSRQREQWKWRAGRLAALDSSSQARSSCPRIAPIAQLHSRMRRVAPKKAEIGSDR